MTNAMSYKGYDAVVAYDDKDQVFTGRVANTTDRVYFHGETVAELRRAFHESVDGYLAVCERVGKTPEKRWLGD